MNAVAPTQAAEFPAPVSHHAPVAPARGCLAISQVIYPTGIDIMVSRDSGRCCLQLYTPGGIVRVLMPIKGCLEKLRAPVDANGHALDVLPSDLSRSAQMEADAAATPPKASRATSALYLVEPSHDRDIERALDTGLPIDLEQALARLGPIPEPLHRGVQKPERIAMLRAAWLLLVQWSVKEVPGDAFARRLGVDLCSWFRWSRKFAAEAHGLALKPSGRLV